MKRRTDLMEAVLDLDNLMTAFHRAAKGKAARREVMAFRKHLSRNISQLQRDLGDGSMTFGRYSFFRVHDPKTRDICAAAFRERVVHHSLINICGSALDRSQIFHSYACRKGKGQHRALDQAAKWACHHEFYLKMDVAKFFDSINHEILKKMLWKKIRDRQVHTLFSRIIDSHETVPGKGLPLGNLTSQYFANFYLTGFDCWITQEAKPGRYLRYMDDMAVFGTLENLKNLRTLIEDYLGRILDLSLKGNGQINRTQKGMGFLGSVVHPGFLRLSSRTQKRVRQKFKSREKDFQKGLISEKVLQHDVQSLWAGLAHAKSLGWRKNLAAESCVA